MASGHKKLTIRYNVNIGYTLEVVMIILDSNIHYKLKEERVKKWHELSTSLLEIRLCESNIWANTSTIEHFMLFFSFAVTTRILLMMPCICYLVWSGTSTWETKQAKSSGEKKRCEIRAFDPSQIIPELIASEDKMYLPFLMII